MHDPVAVSPTVWRQVRWCDQHLDHFHRRILLLAWLPQALDEHLPWYPVIPALCTAAHTLTCAPYHLLEPVPGHTMAFRPTPLGELVVWFHLLGQQPDALRSGLHPVPPPAAPPPTSPQRRPLRRKPVRR